MPLQLIHSIFTIRLMPRDFFIFGLYCGRLFPNDADVGFEEKLRQAAGRRHASLMLLCFLSASCILSPSVSPVFFQKFKGVLIDKVEGREQEYIV